MDAKNELEGNYLRPHFSERELDRYEQQYLECCLIPEMEERVVRKEEDYLPGPETDSMQVRHYIIINTFPVLSHNHFNVLR